MANTVDGEVLLCDGCGQVADSAHISRRLERLAWSTRYRPLHIQALLVSGIAPVLNSDFLYSPQFGFSGEGGELLRALGVMTDAGKNGRPASLPASGLAEGRPYMGGTNATVRRQDAETPHAKVAYGAPGQEDPKPQISTKGKSVEAVQVELQKLGIMLIHVLECPVDSLGEGGSKLPHSKTLIERQLAVTLTRIRRSLKPKRLLLLSAELLPFAAEIRSASLPCAVLPAEGVFLPTWPSTEEEREAFRNGLALSNPRAV